MTELGPEGKNSVSRLCWKKDSASTRTEAGSAVWKFGSRRGKVTGRGHGGRLGREQQAESLGQIPLKTMAEPGAKGSGQEREAEAGLSTPLPWWDSTPSTGWEKGGFLSS